MQFGALNTHAPELRLAKWIDANGKETKPVRLADLGAG